MQLLFRVRLTRFESFRMRGEQKLSQPQVHHVQNDINQTHISNIPSFLTIFVSVLSLHFCLSLSLTLSFFLSLTLVLSLSLSLSFGCYFRALDFEGEKNTLGWVRLG